MAFLCVSQQGHHIVQKHHTKLFAKKVEKKSLFPVVFPRRFLFPRFFAVPLSPYKVSPIPALNRAAGSHKSIPAYLP
jgi:hypothetical protein